MYLTAKKIHLAKKILPFFIYLAAKYFIEQIVLPFLFPVVLCHESFHLPPNPNAHPLSIPNPP